MKRSNDLSFKLTDLLSKILRSIILFVGLNIIFTTIFVIMKEEIQYNLQKEISFLYVRDIR